MPRNLYFGQMLFFKCGRDPIAACSPGVIWRNYTQPPGRPFYIPL
ncbi:MAG TPA: hypothetical protein VEX13_13020 [Chloroflexia bacterium]|nr:hypothetical protein [Chloroflexia bacterium]